MASQELQPSQLEEDGGVANDGDIGKNLKETLEVFVTYFYKHYIEKYKEYVDETLGNREKSDKCAKIFQLAIPFGPLGKGLKFLGEQLGTLDHKRKASKIAKQISIDEDSLKVREILVNAGVAIFASYESQFMSLGLTRVEIKKIAKDAVERVMNYHSNEEDSNDLTQNLITKAVLRGKSKGLVGSVGRNIETKFGDKWEDGFFFEKVGIVTLKSDGTVDKYFKKKNESNEFGYRRLFQWESKLSDLTVMLEDYKEDKSVKTKYMYILTDDLSKKYSEEILNEINGKDLGLKLTEIKDEVSDVKAAQIESSKILSQNHENILTIKDGIEILKQSARKSLKRNIRFRVKNLVKACTVRYNELQTIADNINDNIVVISGLHGVGKTELALKYARSQYDKSDSVVWINAQSKSTMTQSFMSLYDKLGLKLIDSNETEEKDLTSIAEEIYEYITGDKTLYVFDDAESFSEIEKFLPVGLPTSTKKPRILVTTLNSLEWRSTRMTFTLVPLSGFKDNEAENFVREYLHIDDDSEKDIKSLGQKLHNFPLALFQAVSYIKYEDEMYKSVDRNARYSIKDYLKLYEEKEQEMLNDDVFKNLCDGYDKTTLTALQISLDKVKEHGEKAIEVINILSYLASDKIPTKFFLRVFNNDIKGLSSVIDTLKRYSIVNTDKDYLSIQGLLQSVRRLEIKDIEENILQEGLEIVMKYICREIEDTYLPHVVTLWKYAKQYSNVILHFLVNNREQLHKDIKYFHLIVRGSSYEVVEAIINTIEAAVNAEGLKELINEKVNDEDARHYYTMPLHNAVINGDVRIVQLLLSKGANVDVRSKYQWTPLHLSAKNGNLEIFQVLINANAKCNVKTGYGFTPLHLAARNGHFEIVQYLMNYNIPLPMSDIEKFVKSKALKTHRFEKEPAIDVNASDHRDFRPLHHAVKNNHIKVVEILLKNSELRIDAENEHKLTALHFAAKNGSLEIFTKLLEKGANINVRNEDDFTPLHYSAFYNHLDILNELLKREDLEANCETNQGNTALHLAAEKGNFEIVQALVESNRVCTNSKNKENQTPLDLAISKQHLKIKEYLIENTEIDDQALANEGEFIRREDTAGMGGQLREIELIMLFLLYGTLKKDQGEVKSFSVASNIYEAADFDDVVFKYINKDDSCKIIFLQSKHKEKETNISSDTLFSDNEKGHFILRKYLNSYWKIEQQFKTKFNHDLFKNKIENCHFFVYTNAAFNTESPRLLLQLNIEEEDVLSFNLETAKCYKLDDTEKEVVSKLQDSLDFEVLTKEVAESVAKGCLDQNKAIFEDYQFPLLKTVFERTGPDHCKFKDGFLDKSKNDFSRSVLDKLIKKRVFGNAEEEVKEKLREKKLTLSKDFGNVKDILQLPLPNKQFTKDEIEAFSSRLKIFVNQPNKDVLGEFIRNRIREGYNVNQEEAESIYSEVRSKIINWWGGRKKCIRYITENDRVFEDAARTSIRFDVTDPVSLFVGREDELSRLHISLQNNFEVLISQTASVTGLGGVGKTELAREYIRRHNKDYDGNFIWINAENYSTLAESFRRLAIEKLKIKTKDECDKEKNVESIVKEIYEYVTRRHKRCLFVFDNAGKYKTVNETDEGIDKFLPKGPNKPHILITSRNQDWGSIAKIELKVFTEDEALEFLTKHLSGVLELNEAQLKELCEKLQRLPLALNQAVVYIKMENNTKQAWETNKFTIGDYLKRYEETMFLSQTLEELDDYTRTVLTTWSVTMNKVKTKIEGDKAEEIMNILAYLSPNNIPAKGVFTNLIDNEAVLCHCVELLNQYSMASLDGGVINIHRVVQDITRITLDKNKEEKKILGTALRLLNIHIESSRNRTGGPYTTHAMVAWNHAKKYDELVRIYSRLPWKISDKLEESVRYEEAYLFGTEAIALLEEKLGEDHPDILPIFNVVGTVHSRRGEYDKSISLFREWYEKSNRILGPDHNDTIMASSNIAVVLDLQGKYSDSIELHNQVLNRRRELCGEDNYDTLTSKNNIAVEYQKMGEFKKALDLCLAILPEYRKSLGEDDLDTLMVKNNIAVVLKSLGRYDEALTYYNEILPIRQRLLGDEHPDTLLTMHGIGVVYDHMQRPDEALEAYRKVAEKREKLLGENHPDVLGTKQNIAGILIDKGECKEALPILFDILEKRKKKLGENHADTAMTLHNIGLAYEKSGNDAEALKNYNKSFEIRERVLGKDHVDTLQTKCNIAGIYSAKGNHDTALQIYQEVLPIFQTQLGPEHPHTQTVQFLLSQAKTRLAAQLTTTQLANAFEFDEDMLLMAIARNDPSFVEVYLHIYSSELQNETIKNNIRIVLDSAYKKLANGEGDESNLQIIIALLRTAINETVDDALFRAVNGGHSIVVTYLINSGGADINAVNNDLNTPLHLAVQNLNERIIDILLEEKPNLNVVNKYGKTPIDLISDKIKENPGNENLEILLAKLISMTTS